MTHSSTRRAVARFALAAAAAVAAASLWAASRPEQGLLLDAWTWQAEVVESQTGPWPPKGWYRLVATEQGVEVRNVQPTERTALPSGALFFRLRGTELKTGLRPSQRQLEVLHRAQGTSLPGRFSLQVAEVDAGVRYQVSYGGHDYRYLVGPKGSSTSVRAVADLDGDGKPDFLVDVQGLATYLLLSSKAQPGLNLPTAEMPFDGV